MRFTIFAAAMLVSMGTAHAAVVGSAPAFSGGQAVAVCYYSNLSNTPINFSESLVLGEPGTALPEASETCAGPILGRCRTVANIGTGTGAVWCRAVVNDKKNIRGRLEIRNASGVTLTSEEAR
jgi:hypothetical protein